MSGRQGGWLHVYPDNPRQDIEKDEEFMALAEKSRTTTMTSLEAMYALYQAVRYVVKEGIPGDLCECGVWRGGSALLMANTLLQMGDTSRKLWLYDTFGPGMTEPEIENDGEVALKFWQSSYMRVELESVADVLRPSGYPQDKIMYRVGDVSATLRNLSRPEKLSILRLDTDWYRSTKDELEFLYPVLSPGGYCIIDDYFHWQGSKKATDEYFRDSQFLHRVDYSVRLLVKP